MLSYMRTENLLIIKYNMPDPVPDGLNHTQLLVVQDSYIMFQMRPLEVSSALKLRSQF